MKFLAVLVCGGRDYNCVENVFHALDKIHAVQAIDLVVSGGAEGADALAERWARANEVALHVEPAKWAKYGKAAGPRRNAIMGNLLAQTPGAKILVAFPGGRGTENMVDAVVALIHHGVAIDIIRPGDMNDDPPAAAA